MSADEAAEAASRYAEELEELTFNSKPIITSLSMIAEEFLPVSAAIVAVIEKKIAAAAADKKLPVLYLLDSICKNVQAAEAEKDYVRHFSHNLPAVVAGAFDALGPRHRLSVQKLVKTWVDGKIFSVEVLEPVLVTVGLADASPGANPEPARPAPPPPLPPAKRARAEPGAEVLGPLPPAETIEYKRQVAPPSTVRSHPPAHEEPHAPCHEPLSKAPRAERALSLPQLPQPSAAPVHFETPPPPPPPPPPVDVSKLLASLAASGVLPTAAAAPTAPPPQEGGRSVTPPPRQGPPPSLSEQVHSHPCAPVFTPMHPRNVHVIG